jgi:hypothetical protein
MTLFDFLAWTENPPAPLLRKGDKGGFFLFFVTQQFAEKDIFQQPVKRRME